MDHAEARELLELAAIEPGGLDRLITGTDSASVDVVAHLRGCAECRNELDTLRRSVATIRDAVQTTPPAALRARTLDQVARLGRERSRGGGAGAPSAGASNVSTPWFRRRLVPAFAAGIAAVALVGAVVFGSAVSTRLADADAAIAEQRATIAGLALVTDWSLRLGADPDAMRVRLEPPGGGAPAGSIVFSDGTNELLMVANGLPAPAAGEEYRCWVEVDGARVPIGAMYRAGDLAYWAGDIGEAVGDGEGRTFGVSLVPSASDGVDGDVLLVGES